MANGQRNTLRGWKEIAAYVGRDVRTVQRWEARRGFPVTRLPGGERGNVYALASEVDEWLHPSARPAPVEEAPPVPVVAAAVSPTQPEAEMYGSGPRTLSEAAPAMDAPYAGPAVQVSLLRPWTGNFGWGLGALAIAVAAALIFFRSHQERVQATATADHAQASERYPSPGAAIDPLYLQGMYLFEKRTPDSLVEAKQMLLKVTERDPKNALAWSGLAQVGTLLYEYGVEIDPGAPMRARAAAERALALDSRIAEPHAVLGFADFFWEHDVRGAEPEFQNALRINPSSALVRSWYGTLLTYEARYPEALEQLDRAQLLQPSSTAILSNRALALGLSGRREEAMRLLEKAGGENPIASVRFHLAVLSLMRPFNAPVFLTEELKLAKQSHSENEYRLYTLAQEAYRRGGEPAMWRSILSCGERQYVGADLLAGAHAALGENDAAFEVLAKAQRESGPLVGISMHPLLLPLHRDPRFRQFVSEGGFPPVS